MREVIHYKTATGHDPVKEFLDSLSGKQAAKVTWVLSLIEDLPSFQNSISRSWSERMIFGR